MVLDISFITNWLLEQNTSSEYIFAVGLFIGLLVVFRLLDFIISFSSKRLATRTKTHWDDIIANFLTGISIFYYAFLALYISLLTLSVPSYVGTIFDVLLIVFTGYYLARGVGSVSDKIVQRYIAEKKETEELENISLLRLMGFVIKLIVWVIVVLMVLNNLNIEITPLIASLGVGGIAIALALQTVLGDLFSAIAIYFDKPFKEGDFIIIGDDMGVVKHIGIKTTRIQSLSGQELVVSNSELTSTRINNYKRMQKRRVAFNFGIEYGTPNKKIKKIRSWFEQIVKDVNKGRGKKKGIDLDRIHFKGFGDSSLNFEVVYYVPTADYNEYMNIQEELNLGLKERFEKEKINFAFPSRTIYMSK